MQDDIGFSTAPYFEIAARDLLASFGPDTMSVIDRTIEALARSDQTSVLDTWRQLRLALARTPVAHVPPTLH